MNSTEKVVIHLKMATILKHWREAATLILAAKSKNIGNGFKYEILMMKRSGRSTFMPSLSVFPGGVAEESDFSPEWLDLFTNLGKDFCQKTFDKFTSTGPAAHMFSRKRDDQYSSIPSEVAFRICAIRETFEECGILLTRSSKDKPLDWLSSSNDTYKYLQTGKVFNMEISEFETWREKVDKDASQFIKMCKTFNIVPDIWSLGEWANWLTPVSFARKASKTDEGSKRRYDTAFFICLLDSIPDALHDDKETVHLQWSSPEDLIKSHLQGKMKLAPPQIYEICKLLNFQNFEELHNFTLERRNKRVKRIFPIPILCDDGIFVVYPGDDLYPENPDIYGEHDLVVMEGTLQEINQKFKNQNRYVMKDKNSHRDFISEVQFLCNVSVDGNVIPVTDLSILGIPRARF